MLNKKISYVIPCYNSEKTIKNVVDEICNTMKKLKINNYEIVLVNDSSRDETFKVIKELIKRNNKIIGLNLAKNFGQHAALMAGFHYVDGDIIVCLDDDGQTPANEVDKLLNKVVEGYDVCYASYAHKEHNGFRNFGSKINDLMTRLMLNKPKDLKVTSYFAAKKFIIDEMIRYEHSYPYVIGLVLRSTKNICNVDVTHRRREIGESNYSLSKLLSLWMNGFTSFSIKPLRLATYIGAISALVGFIYTIVVIIKHFAFGLAPQGWSSLTSIILILGGIILIVLGLIGEYVGRIYMCSNATPQYVVKEIIRK